MQDAIRPIQHPLPPMLQEASDKRQAFQTPARKNVGVYRVEERSDVFGRGKGNAYYFYHYTNSGYVFTERFPNDRAARLWAMTHGYRMD